MLAADSSKPPKDIVSYGWDPTATIPRNLSATATSPLRLLIVAAIVTLGFVLAVSLGPSSMLVPLAQLLNHLVWSHVQAVSLDGCTSRCHLMETVVIVVPVYCLIYAIVAFFAFPRAWRSWKAIEEGLRSGAAPLGRSSNNEIRQPPTILWLLLAVFVAIASCYGLGLVLHMAVNNVLAASSTLPRRPPQPFLVVFYMGGIMAGLFFPTIGAISGLTCITMRLKTLLKL